MLVYIYRQYSNNDNIQRGVFSGFGEIYFSHNADAASWISKPGDILTKPKIITPPGVVITTIPFHSRDIASSAIDVLKKINEKKEKYKIPKSFNDLQKENIKLYIDRSNADYANRILYSIGTQLII